MVYSFPKFVPFCGPCLSAALCMHHCYEQHVYQIAFMTLKYVFPPLLSFSRLDIPFIKDPSKHIIANELQYTCLIKRINSLKLSEKNMFIHKPLVVSSHADSFGLFAQVLRNPFLRLCCHTSNMEENIICFVVFTTLKSYI